VGEHNREILMDELGLGRGEFDELGRRGII